MKIELNKEGSKYIELYLCHYDIEELKEWGNLLFQTLLFAFYKKPVHLITLSPQKYSLGFEISNQIQIKAGKDTLLVNFIESCSENLLNEIAESEEFKRGLLRFVTIEPDRLQYIARDVSFKFLDADTIAKVNFDFELITCEGDGKILYWFNPPFPIHIIETKFKEISNNSIEII
jgi:hypothetical protein